MAADGVDLIDISAGFEKDVCCVNLILQRDAGNGAAHQGRAAAGDHCDEEIIGTGAIHQLQNFLTGAVPLLVGQGMSPHKDAGLPEDVCRLGELNDGNAVSQALPQDFLHRHSHVVAGLAGTHEIDMAFFAQVPTALPDTEKIALHMGDAVDARAGVQLLERGLRNVQHDFPTG